MAKVFVYRNLHRKCWSIRHKDREIAHAPAVFIWDGDFQVSEAGNEKVRMERKKNVHAFVVAGGMDDVFVPEETQILQPEGYELFKTGLIEKFGQANEVQVAYNPYEMKHFSEVSCGEPIHWAETVYLNADGCVFTPDMRPIISDKGKKAKATRKEKGVDNVLRDANMTGLRESGGS